jgi:hypothetical protein
MSDAKWNAVHWSCGPLFLSRVEYRGFGKYHNRCEQDVTPPSSTSFLTQGRTFLHPMAQCRAEFADGPMARILAARGLPCNRSLDPKFGPSSAA